MTTLAELARADDAGFVAALGSVFEHAPWVARAALAHRPFASGDELHAAMMGAVRALPEAERVEFLCAHPELAGAQARAGTMTADSVAEQGGLALAALGGDEAAAWDRLNAAYRARFGFPFVLCIRRHSRASALRTFERRLCNERAAELATAVDEIGRISRLRLAARVSDHGMTGLAGRLSTHVLDLGRGRPAAGLRIELFEAGGGRLVDALTDAKGEIGGGLLVGAPLRIGRYELRFHVGAYFRGVSGDGVCVGEGDEPFLDVVPVAFGIDDPEGDYRVPLTITPWAYGTCRVG